MEFSRQDYWSGLPCPSPGDLPDPGIEPRSPELQADSDQWYNLISVVDAMLLCLLLFLFPLESFFGDPCNLQFNQGYLIYCLKHFLFCFFSFS